MRAHKTVILLTLGFLIGISVLLYPAFSNYWNSKTQSRAIVDYESVLEYLEPEDYSAIFQAAYDYNEALYKVEFPLRDYEEVPGYYDTLKIEGTKIIGYVKISKIGVELPVYHGTSDMVLSRGVGHLEGTSLPVGGTNTNCVIAGHRGYSGAAFFRYVPELKPGDEVIITNLWETMTYVVTDTKIIMPNEVDQILIQEGRDMITLLTCHPYASGGKQRYLVFCDRVTTE